GWWPGDSDTASDLLHRMMADLARGPAAFARRWNEADLYGYWLRVAEMRRRQTGGGATLSTALGRRLAAAAGALASRAPALPAGGGCGGAGEPRAGLPGGPSEWDLSPGRLDGRCVRRFPARPRALPARTRMAGSLGGPSGGSLPRHGK